MWSAPSFVFLKNLQGSCLDSLCELLSWFQRSLSVWFLWGLARCDNCFSIRILPGAVVILSLAFPACIPESLRNWSGVNSGLWNQRKFIWTWWGPQNAVFCASERLRQFFVTLPSTSSETWVIQSFLFLGEFVFRAWSFLGRSLWLSFLVASILFQCSSLLFLKKVKINRCLRTEIFKRFWYQLGKMNWKAFGKTVTDKKHLFFLVPSYLHFLYMYPFLGAKHKCLHAKSKFLKGKVLSLMKIRAEMPTLAGNQNLFFRSVSSLMGCVVSIFRQK